MGGVKGDEPVVSSRHGRAAGRNLDACERRAGAPALDQSAKPLITGQAVPEEKKAWAMMPAKWPRACISWAWRSCLLELAAAHVEGTPGV